MHYHGSDVGQPALGRQSENSSSSRDIHGVCHDGAQASAFHVQLLQSQFFHGSDIDENSERERERVMSQWFQIRFRRLRA